MDCSTPSHSLHSALSRRDLVKLGFAVGIGFSFSDLGGLFAPSASAANESSPTPPPSDSNQPQAAPDLVAVRGASRIAMLDAALAALGGIEAFVKKGQSVVIKPNAAWDKPENLAANTHPDIVGHMVKLCLKAGAREVNVFDHTCDNWQISYKKSGIQAAVEAAGGKMVNGNDEAMYVQKQLPGAKRLTSAKVHKLITDSDVYINMPVLKHHGGAVMTCCLKNAMGIVWDRGFYHKNDLHQCIADTIILRKPDLNIVDAWSPMLRNGPKGKDESDLIQTKSLIASRDAVAADAAAAMILGHQADGITHVKMAASAGHGSCDLSKLNIKKLVLS